MVEQVAQRRDAYRRHRRRLHPGQRPDGAEQQPIREDIVLHPEAPALKAGDDRTLAAIVAAQFDSGVTVAQGWAPSRGPMRSAWAAMPPFLAFFSDVCGLRPSVISSEEET